MPEHSSRRPVESTVAPRPRPGRTPIKVVGLLLTLALVAGQPVARAILPSEPDGPTTLAGSSSTASGGLDQSEPEALEQQNHQPAQDQQTGPNQYDIVGKFEAHTAGADKDTRLIQRLKDEYERTHPKP
jgi:hypothetical protein